MNGVEKSISFVNVAEYLEGEPLSDIRHEYIDGLVYAMAGGTRNHNRISGNIFSALDDQLHSGSCNTFISDMKVRLKSLSNDYFYYPDVVVSCDKSDINPLYLEKPSLIVEVLSDSTERIDRNEKFIAYKSIPTLNEYVLISQKDRMVTVVRRANDWKQEIYSGEEFELQLSCLNEPLSSKRIYRNVDFS